VVHQLGAWQPKLRHREIRARRHSEPASSEIRTWDRLRAASTKGEKARRGLGIEPNLDRFVDADDCVVPSCGRFWVHDPGLAGGLSLLTRAA
jgi:hypothetical protein